jgi:transcriptional regulator with XRE-family HTH domain
MTELATWLQAEMERRGLTQAQVAVYAEVGQATVSGILRKSHVPRLETLFRLADYFGLDRVEILRLAGHLRRADELTPVPLGLSRERGADEQTPVPLGLSRERPAPQAPPAAGEEALTQALLEEWHSLPDAWKPLALQQVRFYRLIADGLPLPVP